jgi:hypothetical protein
MCLCVCVCVCVRERESNKENVSIGNMCVCVREIGERVRERREKVSECKKWVYVSASKSACDCK